MTVINLNLHTLSFYTSSTVMHDSLCGDREAKEWSSHKENDHIFGKRNAVATQNTKRLAMSVCNVKKRGNKETSPKWMIRPPPHPLETERPAWGTSYTETKEYFCIMILLFSFLFPSLAALPFLLLWGWRVKEWVWVMVRVREKGFFSFHVWKFNSCIFFFSSATCKVLTPLSCTTGRRVFFIFILSLVRLL